MPCQSMPRHQLKQIDSRNNTKEKDMHCTGTMCELREVKEVYSSKIMISMCILMKPMTIQDFNYPLQYLPLSFTILYLLHHYYVAVQ